MIVGCLETIQEQGSSESLVENWPLFLIPPAIFLGQTAPVFAARKFTNNASDKMG